MDSETLPIELERAAERFDRDEQLVAERMGYGDTRVGLGITKRYISKLAEHLKSKLAVPLKPRNNDITQTFAILMRDLSADTISLCCLQTILHCVGTKAKLRDTFALLGLNISGECWSAKLTVDQPKLAARIDRVMRRRSGSLDRRMGGAKAMADAASYKRRSWSKVAQLRAGEWLLNRILECLPDVFECVEQDGEYYVGLTEGGLKLADEIISETIIQNPVFAPTTEPPRPWTGWNEGGVNDPRHVRVSLLRSRHKDVAAAVKHAIKTGTMKPVLDGVNTLQAVAWQINKPVLDVLKQCAERGIEVTGLPSKDRLKTPKKPLSWDAMTQAQRNSWHYQVEEVRRANRTRACDQVMLGLVTGTADEMAKHERFYTAMNCDWRGRVYSLGHFSFQRDDRVRALFQFADGQPIGEEGLRWLKIHVANCGDFDKISKRTLQERVEWVDQNISMITTIATSPMSHLTWTKADKPFLFLAAAMELSAALAEGPQYVTRLPVSFDASASGLQHLCAMTRAAEGYRVNLTSAGEPQDVYTSVADIVIERLKKEDSELAKLSLEYMMTNDRRKVVKRNVMTYSYSSRMFGMAQQQDEDLLVPLKHEVTEGKREEHPFLYYADKKDHETPSSAALYLAKHIFAAIEEVVQLPAQAMKFLQKITRALAHEGKPLRWTSPTGLPWVNRYHEPNVLHMRMWLHDRGIQMKLADGDNGAIAKDKAANGVAPNFVHACDASHLLLVANAATSEGITNLATVHDSFGCLASQAGRLNEIIREQFVAMYEDHDMLAEVLAQAKHDLTQANWNRLPEVPSYGPLNIKEVLNAPYAFS